MAEHRKPILPDPGEGRWWQIVSDDDWFELQLMQERVTYADDTYLATERIYDGPNLRAESFENAARMLLDRVNKQESFIGTYHKKENN